MYNYDQDTIKALEKRIAELTQVLTTWSKFVTENPGVPRYTITPGAGLNELVTWTNGVLRK